MAKNRRKAKSKPGPAGVVPISDLARTTDPGDEIDMVELWKRSRSGARAGRGFHFQDAIGAWFAAKVAAAAIPANALVPEGLEDLVLEGPEERLIQVKSRSKGAWAESEVARLLVQYRADHQRLGLLTRPFTLVVEGTVDGMSLRDPILPLADSLPSDSGLRSSITNECRRLGLADDGDTVLSTTALVAVSWDEVDHLTCQQLTEIHPEVPAVQGLLARHLRYLVATAADENIQGVHDDRTRLDRSGLIGHLSGIVEQVDINGLEQAIRDGVCSHLNWSPAAGGDHFYEGVSTQPSHVAAGLVVQRPDLVREALIGLAEDEVVLFTGPSGVGKSAVLWTVPQALPGVIWFRVDRLAPSDVGAVLRLARAYNVSHDSPVGLLVDAAGTGLTGGWAELLTAAGAVPGLLLAGSARTEDLLVLGDIAGCRTIGVELNEDSAERIYAGLAERGSTDLAHWREAYDHAEGLTLEFTYLLTQGRRLRDVIDDQIRRRVDEMRTTELDILSVVSVAHQWSAELTIDGLSELTGLAPFDLRRSIARLAEEHLLTEADGYVSGLHPVRSQAISSSIHGNPPPTLQGTVARAMTIVPANHLHRFVAGALAEEPELIETILAFAEHSPLDLDQAVGLLTGVRLADFLEVARQWLLIADRHHVPMSSRSVLFQFAAADLDFSDSFPKTCASLAKR